MNLFADLPQAALPAEISTQLLQHVGVRIERIVSTGQSSPVGFWYEQDEHEWVLVLSGHGSVEFADGRSFHLAVGDHLEIPAGLRHRVGATAPDQVTLWLAVFFR